MTIWLTNGTQTFEVPPGSPIEKRLRADGYEDAPDSSAPEVPADPEVPAGKKGKP